MLTKIMFIEHEEQFRMSIRTMTREVKYLVNIELSLRLCLLRGGKALRVKRQLTYFFHYR
jgi:hypothetical protein